MVFLAYAVHRLYQTHLQNITLRLQGLSREKSLQASEKAQQETSKILEMIARGAPASAVYDAIALLYESKHPGMRCSLLELKGNQLLHGGAPSLPKTYCEAVNGLKNGPNIGSCGTSTYTGERVLVEDIATDPKWENLKDVALPHGLRSCWSEPIKNSKGKVLGAFGMYYNYPALPNDQELADLAAGARLAGIVMERQQREDLLQKLYGAFEHTQDAIMICDLEAKLEYVNPAFERMTGYSAPEAIGQYIKILRSDQHPPSFYEKLEAQDHAGQHWQGEIIIKRKDGTLLEVERTVSPIFDQHGTPIFLVAIQRDLTEHKLLEAKFTQAQKMEAIGTLVGGIAHDFNNILAGIMGNVYLLQMHFSQDSNAAQKLNRIDQLSERATGLIQQMLTFARKDTVSMINLELSQLVTEVFGLIRTSIPKNIVLNLDVAQNNISIHGDTTQIHQVLLNLVNN
ncbi:MAG: PAS domain S-box protein, partial [Ghiorsea sp.]|nr:PAS domain S-box protein [Ghiorsea sp.]